MMHTRESLNDRLDELYKELDAVQGMSEESVCATFNADSKREYIALLNEEIDTLEDNLREYDSMMEWDDMEDERTSLCLSQGLPRY